MEKNKQKKSILGRGLSSLLPENPLDEKKEGFAYIKIALIDPNPHQPRQNIPIASIVELSDSIKEKGVMTPLTVVVSSKDSSRYTLVAGERRMQAAKLAGFTEVPAVIRTLSEQDIAELAIIENIHRKELNPLEEGYAYLRLTVEFGMSVDTIAAKISKSQGYVENKLRLTRLPKLIQNSIALGEISENHGKALYGLNDEEAMIAALKIVIRNNLTAPKTEELVRQIKAESMGQRKFLRTGPTVEWEQKFNYIKDELIEQTGFDIKLKKSRKSGGSLVINFADDDGLVSIYRTIKGTK